MSFPDLERRPDTDNAEGKSLLWCENTGVPVNGPNTFRLPYLEPLHDGSGLRPSEVGGDWMVVRVRPLGSGVVNATPAVPFLSPDKQFATIDFSADGIESARVTIQLVHSVNR